LIEIKPKDFASNLPLDIEKKRLKDLAATVFSMNPVLSENKLQNEIEEVKIKDPEKILMKL